MSLPYDDLGKGGGTLGAAPSFHGVPGKGDPAWESLGAGSKATAVPNFPDQMRVLIKEPGDYFSASTECVQIIKWLLIPH